MFGHAVTAVPIYVNLALQATERVAGGVWTATTGTERPGPQCERPEASLRNQLGGEVTALLLNAEMVRREKSLPTGV
jgi:hypothetical protein